MRDPFGLAIRRLIPIAILVASCLLSAPQVQALERSAAVAVKLAAGSSLYFLGGMNGELFFELESGLWKTDGTPAGTIRLSPAVPMRFHFHCMPCPPHEPEGGSAVAERWDPGRHVRAHLHAGRRIARGRVNGALLFQKGLDIWRSDGTVSGTTMLITEANFGGPSGGRLFFNSSSTDPWGTLWVTDGTIPGTIQLTDFGAGVPKCFGPACYFGATIQGVSKLWKMDGTPGGTVDLVKVVLNGTAEFVDVNGTVYFSTFDTLWKTNGTPAGTLPVAAVEFPHQLVSAYGQLFFIGSAQLWRSDGTLAGTGPVRDFGADRGVVALEVVDGRLLLRVDGPACPRSPCLNSTVTGRTWFVQSLERPSGFNAELWGATHVFFGDVAPDHWAFALVERLGEAGVTVGCNPERYCPDDPVTRAQMAVLLERQRMARASSRRPGPGRSFPTCPRRTGPATGSSSSTETA